jgi:hypothetical protein
MWPKSSYPSTSKSTDELAKEAAVQLVIDNQTDHKIMAEALKRATRIIQNPGASSELFLYKVAELKRAIEQVKVYL